MSRNRTASAEEASRPRPKIGDVAALAGVSLGTVSAVLNGNGRVSEATREHVQKAIAALGYRPSLYASNLARRETRLLGLIVSNLQNPFFAETAQAMDEEARRHGFHLSLMASNFSPTQHREAVQRMLGARIAGLAVLTSEHDETSRLLVARSGVPAVLLDVGQPQGHCSVLRVDAAGGMRSAVQHLIALGHRNLLYVRHARLPGGPALRSHRLRDQGFAAAVRPYAGPGFMTHLVEVDGPGAEAGEQAIAATWGTVAFTAVIAITDIIALGVYRALQARGCRIPEDVSVVGFDDTEFSRFLSPPLTTVHVSRTKMSAMVVQALLSQGEGRRLRLPTELVVRASTAAPRGAGAGR